MKNLILILAATLGTYASAADSTWRLCQGDVELFDRPAKLVVNVLEHRSSIDGRVMDLTLVYGGNVLQGTFDSTNFDEGRVTLTTTDSYFVGTVKVDLAANSLQLKGDLNLLGSKTSIDGDLTCQTLSK